MSKKLFITTLLAGVFGMSLAGVTAANQADEAAIAELLNTSYLKGFYHDLDPELVKTGFHPDIVLSVNAGDQVMYVPLEGWMAHEGVGVPETELTEEHKAKKNAVMEIVSVDVVGNTAAAKAEISIDGKLTYTNFYGLYKINDEWVVVNKLFNTHH